MGSTVPRASFFSFRTARVWFGQVSALGAGGGCRKALGLLHSVQFDSELATLGLGPRTGDQQGLLRAQVGATWEECAPDIVGLCPVLNRLMILLKETSIWEPQESILK